MDAEDDDAATGSRQVIHADTDPDISTAMATLGVRADGGSEEAASRKGKAAAGGRAQTGRPLPPISKRRRTSSESCAAAATDAPRKH